MLWQLGRLLKRIVLRLYDNSHIVSRILIPFLIIAAFNLFMGILGTVGILFAGIVDIFGGGPFRIWKERICRKLWKARRLSEAEISASKIR